MYPIAVHPNGSMNQAGTHFWASGTSERRVNPMTRSHPELEPERRPASCDAIEEGRLDSRARPGEVRAGNVQFLPDLVSQTRSGSHKARINPRTQPYS